MDAVPAPLVLRQLLECHRSLPLVFSIILKLATSVEEVSRKLYICNLCKISIMFFWYSCVFFGHLSWHYLVNSNVQCKRSLYTESEIVACVFPFFHIPFLSKCMLRMRKRRKSNLIRFFYDRQTFRRQCVNVIVTMWGRIYFLTCEYFGRKFRTQCAMTLSQIYLVLVIMTNTINLIAFVIKYAIKKSFLLF